MKPKFFAKPSDFRAWLEEQYNSQDELWVGYYKKGTERPGITWPESVEVALCFGWIDGLRKSMDGQSYMIRFTPRRKDSHWSAINLKRTAELKKLGLMTKAGLKAFRKRKRSNSKRASYDQKVVNLDEEYSRQLKSNQKAWAFFSKLPPSIRKNSNWWVMSAKKEETRARRFDTLIKCSEEGRRIPPLKWNEPKK